MKGWTPVESHIDILRHLADRFGEAAQKEWDAGRHEAWVGFSIASTAMHNNLPDPLSERPDDQSVFDYFRHNWPHLRIWGANGPDGSLDVSVGDVKYRLILDPDVKGTEALDDLERHAK